ncbi:MAG: hypothetical protein ACKVX7_17720 [Planctomycetota bacterium]
MQTLEFRCHAGARGANIAIGVLLCLTIIGIPFGVYVLWRAGGSKLLLSPTDVVARGLTTTKVSFADVARFGLLRVPLRTGGGLGGAMGRARVGGGTHAIHLCFQNSAGKTTRFLVSMFEKHEEIAQTISQIVHRQPEDMITSGFGPRWPAAAAQAA